MTLYYVLLDCYNGRVISRHRSLATLVAAERAFRRRFARDATRGSYLPTTVRREDTARASWIQLGGLDHALINAYEPLTEAEVEVYDRLRETQS